MMGERGEVVWCHCHNMTRDGGMCSEGFCSPEPLDPANDWDAPLIADHRGEISKSKEQG